MNRLVLVLSLSLLVNPKSLYAGEVAQTRIYCLSLRFQTATTKVFGLAYTLDLTTGSADSPNGELAPLDNGIPDFSDDPTGTPGRRPLLKLEKAASNLLLSISGEIGRVHDVQEIASLIQTNWTTTLSLTLTNDPQIVQLPLPTNAARFWRVQVP